MSEHIRVRIRDRRASDYPFSYKLDDSVIISADGHTGVVIDAEYNGPAGGGAFTMTYWVKSDSDGEVRELPLTDLLRFNGRT
jgi:hypothetical protein